MKITKKSILKIAKPIYTTLSYLLLLNGLIWCCWLGFELIDKGRLPNETDGRVIKGIWIKFLLYSVLFMFYGGLIWAIMTALTKILNFKLKRIELL